MITKNVEATAGTSCEGRNDTGFYGLALFLQDGYQTKLNIRLR
jgi:hypothetical protein